MAELAVFYDSCARCWLRFSRQLDVLEIHQPDQVMPALDDLERRVEQDGLFAAGLVSYEAAPAFDDALQTHAPGDFPLLRFGLFAAAEPIDLPAPGRASTAVDWQAQQSVREFSGKVDEIRAAIARGETYQVNLTFPLTGEFWQDPWPFFLLLAHAQPANGAGYLQCGRWTICSVSPELFFTKDGDLLRMRPMKGTAPRGRTLQEDRRQAAELQQSAKNRAENIMILDMVRNDLGRLAPPGEVHTEEICSLEKYPTVWQLTSTASARSGASLAEVFRALFPCASITGAPKVRTMQIISALETQPRQSYTGALGWIGPGRKAHFSVAIRSVLVDQQNNSASYGTGAGITWDSHGVDEYRECLAKAAVLTSAPTDFALIETLRWAPGHGYFLLPEHLDRLRDSAEYFNFACSARRTADYLQSITTDFPPAPQRIRLLLHRDGRLHATVTPLEPAPSEPLKIRLAARPVDSQNSLLYHKTTQRDLYEAHMAEAADADEIVLWNEREEVTECCTANLVVETAGRLVTPSLACGLLPGTYRGFLLQRGIIAEQVLSKDELRDSPHIYLVNAVRKWRRAILC